MLRLIVQTKRRYKLKNKKEDTEAAADETNEHEDKDNKCVTDKETEEGSEHGSNKDQDSDVSFQEDKDEEINTTEKKEEWIDYIKRSTKTTQDYMKKMKIPCWIETHRRLKWRTARRITNLPKERWTSKIFDWHPGLDNEIKTKRLVGRPNRWWEDDINEFIRPGETKEGKKTTLTNNNSWMMEATHNKKWKEEKFTKKQQHPLDWCVVRLTGVFCRGPSPTYLGSVKDLHYGGTGRLFFYTIFQNYMLGGRRKLNDGTMCSTEEMTDREHVMTYDYGIVIQNCASAPTATIHQSSSPNETWTATLQEYMEDLQFDGSKPEGVPIDEVNWREAETEDYVLARSDGRRLRLRIRCRRWTSVGERARELRVGERCWWRLSLTITCRRDALDGSWAWG